MFMAQFCDRCKHDDEFQKSQDGEDGCKIILNTMHLYPDDKNYPPEWVSDDAVGLVNPRCTAFKEKQVTKCEAPSAALGCTCRRCADEERRRASDELDRKAAK